jgi:hypothetical protein
MSSKQATSKINGKGDSVLGIMVYKLVTKEKKEKISIKH